MLLSVLPPPPVACSTRYPLERREKRIREEEKIARPYNALLVRQFC